MDTLKIAFSNVFQLLEHIGEDMAHNGIVKDTYIDVFTTWDADVLCVVEMLFDDADGNSCYVDAFAEQLGYTYHHSQINEESWLIDGKYYGMTIFSKYPLSNYSSVKLLNPEISSRWADGSIQTMHDKYVQKVDVDFLSNTWTIFNIHSIPFHRFNTSFGDNINKDFRDHLSKCILKEKNPRTVIIGDMNVFTQDIETIFPEVFEDKRINSAVPHIEEYIINDTQNDHLFYFDGVTIENPSLIESPSDHKGLYGEFRYEG